LLVEPPQEWREVVCEARQLPTTFHAAVNDLGGAEARERHAVWVGDDRPCRVLRHIIQRLFYLAHLWQVRRRLSLKRGMNERGGGEGSCRRRAPRRQG
jgi:hypothetical protein